LIRFLEARKKITSLAGSLVEGLDFSGVSNSTTSTLGCFIYGPGMGMKMPAEQDPTVVIKLFCNHLYPFVRMAA
jgi:hypothetical protein